MKGILVKFVMIVGAIILVAPSVAYVAPDLVRAAIHRLYAAAQRDHVGQTALSSLKDDAYVFAGRAKQAKISRDDVVRSLQAAEKLLVTPSSRLDDVQRARVAAAIVAQAAKPEIISQGAHSTCSVTTLEIRTFTLMPQVASELIVSVALTGEWISSRGQKIVVKPDYDRPGKEESTYPVAPFDRSQASEIFQVAMLNAVGQQPNPEVTDVVTKQAAKAPIYFVQLPQHLEDGNTGEFWVTEDGRLVNVFTGLSAAGIEKAGNALLGRTDARYLIGNVEQDLPPTATVIDSPADFEQELRKLKSETELPAILMVRGMAPILGSANPRKWERVDHVVTVYQTDSSGTWAYVVNPWGSPFARWLPISLLYDTTEISWPS